MHTCLPHAFRAIPTLCSHHVCVRARVRVCKGGRSASSTYRQSTASSNGGMRSCTSTPRRISAVRRSAARLAHLATHATIGASARDAISVRAAPGALTQQSVRRRWTAMSSRARSADGGSSRLLIGRGRRRGSTGAGRCLRGIISMRRTSATHEPPGCCRVTTHHDYTTTSSPQPSEKRS